MKVLDIFEEATPRDKIISYLKSSRKGNVYLTEAEQRYMDQLDYCDNIIRHNRTLRQIDYINMVVEKYNCSTTTARNLILDAKYVHGSVTKQVKAYERQIMSEVLWELYEKAKTAGEFKAAINALDLIARINGYEKEDDAGADETNPGTVIIRPAFTPEILGVPNPENVDELVDKLRQRTKVHTKAANELSG